MFWFWLNINFTSGKSTKKNSEIVRLRSFFLFGARLRSHSGLTAFSIRARLRSHSGSLRSPFRLADASIYPLRGIGDFARYARINNLNILKLLLLFECKICFYGHI